MRPIAPQHRTMTTTTLSMPRAAANIFAEQHSFVPTICALDFPERVLAIRTGFPLHGLATELEARKIDPIVLVQHHANLLLLKFGARVSDQRR